MSEQTSVTRNEDVMLQRVRRIAEGYRNKPGSLIQVLHAVQSAYGYLPIEVQKVVSEVLGVPLGTVSGVVTFYSFFSTEPHGKHNIRICLGTACYVRGGVRIVDRLEEILGCKVGHTTTDGMAPAIAIDDKVYANVNPDELPNILADYYKLEEEAE
jgi:NADH:ubiquinone oxidoreductase subunit E